MVEANKRAQCLARRHASKGSRKIAGTASMISNLDLMKQDSDIANVAADGYIN